MIFRKPFPRKRMWGSNRNCFGVSLREINFLFVTKTVRRKTAKSVCWSKERKANASSVDRPIGTAPQSSAVFLLFETFSSFVPFYILPLHYVFKLNRQTKWLRKRWRFYKNVIFSAEPFKNLLYGAGSKCRN